DQTDQLVPILAKKNRALLAALALAPSSTMRRERIARLLWSDRGEAQVRSSLRQALVALRKDFAGAGVIAIVVGEEQVKLDLSKVEGDGIAFRRLGGAGDAATLQRAATLYRGELLADMEFRDPEFEAWLAGERRRLNDLAIGVLDKLHALESGAARVAAAKRLVDLDPIREASHLKLMAALAESGERAAALRQYDACREILSAELDAVPGEEIETL